MPILSNLSRKTWSGRMLVAAMYASLILMSLTMVVPFLITFVNSTSNAFDYERYSPFPRYLYSQSDRYVKGLVNFFNDYPKWYQQFQARYPNAPDRWTSWREIGRDKNELDALAHHHLTAAAEHPETLSHIAADYADFASAYPLSDQRMTVSDAKAASFLADRYIALYRRENPELAASMGSKALRAAGLERMSIEWGVPLPNFYLIGFQHSELRQPYWQQGWVPDWDSARYRDFLRVKRAAAHHVFTDGAERKWKRYADEQGWPEAVPSLSDLVEMESSVWEERWSEFKRKVLPAAPVQPTATRVLWYNFLDSREARALLELEDDELFSVETYNEMAGTSYSDMARIPFPPPADRPEMIQTLWHAFVKTAYPVRLMQIDANAEQQQAFQEFLRSRFKTLETANRMLDADVEVWTDFQLTPTLPREADQKTMRSIWMDYVKSLPVDQRKLTSAEHTYQAFLLERYGSLNRINEVYRWDLQHLEEAFPPFNAAYTQSFLNNEWALTLLPALNNYTYVSKFLVERGRAIFVTLVLISLAILATLTINPMAAYALSRFSMKGKDKILLFLLATMAFPAMVSAIPAYLLMRDLGLLNTFFALILPSAANGMAIFILKGFFDSLPRELYEAASLDGAKEWQIFLVITMPMMKPILAINALTAFIHAYNGWEWALIICQDPDMWTLAVWMYQANQWWSGSAPWLVMTGFVIISIPTLLVFLFCQKIIMRGIVLPAMK